MFARFVEEQQKAAEAEARRKEANQKKLSEKAAAESKKKKRKVTLETKTPEPPKWACFEIHFLSTEWHVSLVKTSRWLSSDSSGSWWAAPVAPYCPGRMAEHPKFKSMGGFHQWDGSPCTLSHLRYFSVCIFIEATWRVNIALQYNSRFARRSTWCEIFVISKGWRFWGCSFIAGLVPLDEIASVSRVGTERDLQKVLDWYLFLTAYLNMVCFTVSTPKMRWSLDIESSNIKFLCQGYIWKRTLAAVSRTLVSSHWLGQFAAKIKPCSSLMSLWDMIC